MTTPLKRLDPRRGLGDTVQHPHAKPVVVRCMSCRIQAARRFQDAVALDAIVDAEMVKRVHAWLLRKGIA